MSTAAAAPAKAAEAGESGGGKKKLLLLAIPVVLAAVGAGLWFGGILPPLLGMGPKAEAAKAQAAAEEAKPKPPTFFEMPEIVANLNSGTGKRTSFIKLKARLELAKADDVAAATAGLPRLQDLFQTYLREMRPEELRGSAGTYRLREELIARANIAVAPARVVDVLFTEMLIQ
jgi:flagellar FliL protein